MADSFSKTAAMAKSEQVKQLTSYLLHKHYCENDVEAMISLLDEEDLLWFGTAEHEYAAGSKTVSDIFRQFAGKVIQCNISDEHYDTIEAAPETYICTGRLWVSTDPSTQTYLRVHQRVTTVFRWKNGKPRCCHIHLSNPYIEMMPSDIGFPTTMARQSYEYMQEFIEKQKKLIKAQTEELNSIYNTIPCAIIRVLRKDGKYQLLTSNRATSILLEKSDDEIRAADWSSGFCTEILPEDIPKVAAALDSLKKPGDYVGVAYRICTRSGRLIYFNSNNLLVSQDKEGDVIQRIAFNITRQATLERQSFEDSLTGLFNRNKFNQLMSQSWKGVGQLGVAYFDINGLKAVNDRSGHNAGDALIRRVAFHINKKFQQKAYRIGGDEFIVIDDSRDETDFTDAVSFVCREMSEDHITVAVGSSWRSSGCSLKEQYDEADKIMYKDKAAYYSQKSNDRRKRP